METKIHNFFKFIREKTGKTSWGYILKHAPEDFKNIDQNVKGNLDLDSLESMPEGFNPTVGGDLDLYNLKSIPEGFNPTVGGSLYLRSLQSIPKGFNPTVGGDLYLLRLKFVPKGFNPTVKGDLYLNSIPNPYKTEQEVKQRFPNVKGSIFFG